MGRRSEPLEDVYRRFNTGGRGATFSGIGERGRRSEALEELDRRSEALDVVGRRSEVLEDVGGVLRHWMTWAEF